MRGSGRLDWLTGWWSEETLIAIGRTELDLISSTNLAEYEDDVMVERVIGQYYMRNLSDQSHIWHSRLMVRQVFDGAPPADVALWMFDHADEPFMWHKVHRLEAAGATDDNNMTPVAAPEWSHLDVRVNRRLGDLDTLQFHMEPVTSTVNYVWGAWIRVLIKK